MISVFYGTRPEYIKVFSLYTKLKSAGLPVELVQVQQHTTLIDDCYFDRLVCVDCQTKNRLNQIVCSCMSSDVFLENTSLVVVQGDTSTAFGIGLNAFHSKIPIAHIEAGLRTYDTNNPYPEEAYRRFLSVVSDYNFCVTKSNVEALRAEKVVGKIYCVGKYCV